MTLRIIEKTKEGERTVGMLTEDNQVYHFVKTAEDLEQSFRKNLSKLTKKEVHHGKEAKSA